MSKQAFLDQITAELTRLGVPYQIGGDADLTIVHDFIDAVWSTGTKQINYQASVLLNEQDGTATMWEKTADTDSESFSLSGSSFYRQVTSTVLNSEGQAVKYDLDLGDIAKIVRNTAQAFGWKFYDVLKKAEASFTAVAAAAAPIVVDAAAPVTPPKVFCTQCGNQLTAGARFCTKCGTVQGQADAKAYIPPVVLAAPIYQPQAYQAPVLQPVYGAQYQQPLANAPKKSKVPLIIGIIVGLAVLAGLVWGALYLFGNKDDGDTSDTTKKPKKTTTVEETTAETTEETLATTEHTTPTTQVSIDSGLIVSRGISPDDLGNYVDGVFYFDAGDYIFFPNYDTAGAAHIYRYNTSDGTVSTVFDGYGWSLVAFKGFLYFAGNEGTAIDGSYNLMRMKFDGSDLTYLNSYYNYGVNIYNGMLYFIREDENDDTILMLCRSKLDGSNEEVLLNDTAGQYFFYNDSLYYKDNNKNIYVAAPDGSDPVILPVGNVIRFFFGNNRLIYLDSSDNIMAADLDGQNAEVVRAANGAMMSSVVSYDDAIFYTIYTSAEADPTTEAYPYELHRVGFDGSGDAVIYSGYSKSNYINIANDRVFVLDYAFDPTLTVRLAILRSMQLDGSDLNDLPR